ncbi:hypothetical protein BN2497_713 [Janthinobacterium sp. CG23_2]|nr:hypothetical protein BN2497_713 [Janthinobacterium sp. CG23_2]CUU26754.1 hypothetical protein BN3177_713 [Janthinobacterium sp. CG23_2]
MGRKLFESAYSSTNSTYEITAGVRHKLASDSLLPVHLQETF